MICLQLSPNPHAILQVPRWSGSLFMPSDAVHVSALQEDHVILKETPKVIGETTAGIPMSLPLPRMTVAKMYGDRGSAAAATLGSSRRRMQGASSLGGSGPARSVFDVLPDILADDRKGYSAGTRRMNQNRILPGGRSLNALQVESSQLQEALEQIEALHTENEYLKVNENGS